MMPVSPNEPTMNELLATFIQAQFKLKDKRIAELEAGINKAIRSAEWYRGNPTTLLMKTHLQQALTGAEE